MKKYLLSFVILLMVFVSVPFVSYAEGEQSNHVHEMGQWSVTPATCGKDGYRIRTCTKCTYSEKKIIPATGKHSIKYVMIEKPTCMYGGYAEEYCTNCGLITAEIDLAPTDQHTYGSWKTVSKATAYIGGKKERSCKICGEKQYRSTLKLKKKISKDDQNVKKAKDTFFKYLKKYDIGKMKKSFATPKKVKFFSSKKYLVKYIRKHNKSLSYQIRDIKVTGKTAAVTLLCKYYDSYFNSDTNKIITVKFKKVGKNWKMLKPSSDMYKVMHCNYTKAYNTYY